MSLLDRFLKQLTARGLSVSGPKDGDPADRLYLKGPAEAKTPEVMAALGKFKAALVERFGQPATQPSPAPKTADAVVEHGGELLMAETKEGELRPR